jgi:mycothiol system anti-sigma-R factor
MNCQEVRARLGPHLDGELGVERSLEVNEHLAFCMECQWAYGKERELRTLLRTRVPREPVPEELRERIRADVRKSQRKARWLSVPRLVGWTVPVAALLLVGLGVALWERNVTPPVVNELVAKHLMFSRLEAPAEVVSASQETVSGWFRGRVRFDVVVPDFSPSGIHLLGGRLSDLSDRPVAYLLYEKGRSLVSLFAFPSRGLSLPARGWVRVGEAWFYMTEAKGAEVVLWTQGELAYALVSSLDRQALLECADIVWRLALSRRTPGA